MSLEELPIIVFAVLCGLAAMFFMDPETCKAFCLKLLGHREDVSQFDRPTTQFTIPIFPTYSGKSILETRTTDKEKAEASINAIYKDAGLKAPIIIWTQSPLASVFAKTAIDYFSEEKFIMPWGFRYRNQSDHNDQVRAQAWKSICEAGWNIGDRGAGAEALCGVKLYEDRQDICWGHIPPAVAYDLPNGLENMSRNNAWFDIGDIVSNRARGDWLVDLWARFKFAYLYPDPREYKGGSRSMHMRLIRYKDMLRHQKNLNCLPPQVPDIDSKYAHPTDMRSDFQTLRDTAGWVMPYKYICFVSERPRLLELDENERLHCETGPAMIYPDGFSVHAWHGTVFPEEWIKSKPKASEALYWRNIEQRRVACEMLGWEAILDELDCVSLDKDEDPEIGELVSVKIPSTGEDKFLRVRCGTGRNFALPVPPEMTTARQANAWTWGLSADQYNPEVRT